MSPLLQLHHQNATWQACLRTSVGLVKYRSCIRECTRVSWLIIWLPQITVPCTRNERAKEHPDAARPWNTFSYDAVPYRPSIFPISPLTITPMRCRGKLFRSISPFLPFCTSSNKSEWLKVLARCFFFFSNIVRAIPYSSHFVSMLFSLRKLITCNDRNSSSNLYFLRINSLVPLCLHYFFHFL